MKVADKAMYYSKRYGRNMTIAASKIGIFRLGRSVVAFCKLCLVLAIVGAVGSYFFKDKARAYLPRGFEKIRLQKVVPIQFAADTKIILKTGDVIRGRTVAEDDKAIILEMALGKGTGKIAVEKNKIMSIERAQSKKSEK